MKHLKTYEGILSPKINDYVVCSFDFDTFDMEVLINIKEYMENNLGKIVEINHNNDREWAPNYKRIFKVYYDIPEKYNYNINFAKEKEDYNTVDVCINEIEFNSPDKNLIESYLKSKKYNL
jgi:uncharacterized protein Veg